MFYLGILTSKRVVEIIKGLLRISKSVSQERNNEQ